MSPSKDRRRAPRTVSTVPFDIYDAKGRGVVGEGHFLDLSTSGGRMVTRKILKSNATIRLHVAPNGKPSLQLTGKVIWVRKKSKSYEYGVHFRTRPKTPRR
jgi:hypothetical protein